MTVLMRMKSFVSHVEAKKAVMMMMIETFGDRLTMMMKRKGYTQAGLSSVCHVSRAALSRYAKDQVVPAFTIGQSIAKALGVSTEWLYTGDVGNKLHRYDIMIAMAKEGVPPTKIASIFDVDEQTVEVYIKAANQCNALEAERNRVAKYER